VRVSDASRLGLGRSGSAWGRKLRSPTSGPLNRGLPGLGKRTAAALYPLRLRATIKTSPMVHAAVRGLSLVDLEKRWCHGTARRDGTRPWGRRGSSGAVARFPRGRSRQRFRKFSTQPRGSATPQPTTRNWTVPSTICINVILRVSAMTAIVGYSIMNRKG